MSQRDRREFLASVGQGMLIASVGATLAGDLGLAPATAAEADDSRLTFGQLEPLVTLMQETRPDALQPILVDKINAGADLRTLVAAGALANARSFGGQDYIGYHTLMALMPAWQMSQQMPKGSEPLPVLKVLYRNSERIQEHSGGGRDALQPVTEPAVGDAAKLHAAMRDRDMTEAERIFHGLAQQDAAAAFEGLQPLVQDELNVHRVVLAWRAWDLLHLTGMDHAHTLLRQSVRFCVDAEQSIHRANRRVSDVRTVLPKLLDQYRLAGRSPGSKRGDDAWLAELTEAIFAGSRAQAAEAVASALADGYAAEDIGEAISMAANQLVLHDPGRTKAAGNKGHSGKPIGSVHGDSVGVHASDAANAWRSIARVCGPRNQVASLIVAAYHTAGQAGRVGREPYPFAAELDSLTTDDPARLLQIADAAIRGQDQALAAAAVAHYGKLNHAPRAAYDLLLQYAVSEDGALHGEKYYHTVSEEFARSRPAHRWNHLIALARVTASEYGWPAPGHEDAVARLKG